MTTSNLLSGRVAIITGGSSGLGFASGKLLAANGATIYNFDIAPPKTGDTSFHFIKCDVTSEESVKAAVAAVKGTITMVINCAGGAEANGRTVDHKGRPADYALWKRTIDLNLHGTFNVCRVAAARMCTQDPLPYPPTTKELGELGGLERGVIINFASVAAYDGHASSAAYAASKAAVAGLTIPMARDLKRWGIRVIALAPGFIHTPLVEKLPKEAHSAMAANILFPERFGHPDEVALLVLQCVLNTFINGENIRIDGALRTNNIGGRGIRPKVASKL